ncbi:sulfhydryl oxidase 2-like [Leptopilina heterotoma]|uniref:sulfhydryl oxidase 2-like n=1 Tax=Leptopilina heterotoma TaxID=63436 RepID=UPI001CA913C3|nr:sulfhydryl oxidase 2-like [Leptopilina heterotoma]
MELKITKRNFVFLTKVFLLFLFATKSVNSYSEGLYNTNDKVVILNAYNFYSHVYYSNSSWIVKFYSNWCGHCIRYTPIWKTFARSVQELNSIVRVAALDCANDINSQICRNNQVTRYPDLRFFSANSRPGSLGLSVENENDVASMQKVLLNILETEKQEGRGYLWPNFIPYSGQSLQNIWQTVDDNVKHIVLIFENPGSILGTSVILNFPITPQIHIGRALTYNSALTLIFLQRYASQTTMTINNPTSSDEIEKLIKDKLQNLGVMTNIDLTNLVDEEKVSETPIPVDDKIHKSPDPKIQQFGDVLFQLDLEKTLRYSLKHEIPMSRFITEEKMSALKNYVNILTSYFPMQSNGTTYLLSLQKSISNLKFITGENFGRFSSELENRLPTIYSGNDEWIGCRGSTNIYRGYPCGLWTMFHLLSVNFAKMDKEEDSGKVLKAMHGYVKNFFGCAECSRHFLQMAEKNEIFQVKNKDEGILWLWRAHNEVNRRLAGDATEDPEHKKIQYPSINDCPSCRDGDNNWIESNVLMYLKKKYSSSEVNFYGSSLEAKKLYYHQASQNSSPYMFFYRR